MQAPQLLQKVAERKRNAEIALAKQRTVNDHESVVSAEHDKLNGIDY
jgi:hypothetical protein